MIVFMGVAGSGKSVQGKMLAEKLGYTWISVGELLRKNVDEKRQQEMLLGKLLDDQEIIDMMDKFFAEQPDIKKCILDGFPRTIPQAEWLLDRVRDGSVAIEAVIHLQASQEVVLKRLLSRGRPDDNEQAISKRFAEYEESTLPIVSLLESRGVPVAKIDGESGVDSIHQEIVSKLKELV